MSKYYRYTVDIDLTTKKLTVFQFLKGQKIHLRKVALTKRQLKKLGFLVEVL